MKIPKLTIALAAAITATYIYMSSMLVFASPQNISVYAFWFGQPWNIFFHVFIHASYGHLLTNLAMLLAAGFIIEPKFGWREAGKIFFFGAAFSAIAFVVVNPFNSLVGASGGAAALMAAAFLADPKKTIALALAGAIIAFALSGGINIKVEEHKTAVQNEVTRLEQQKEEAIKANDEQKIQAAATQIVKKTQEQQEIRQGQETAKKTKPNFEVHAFAGIFGAIYMYLFRRKTVQETAKGIFRPVRELFKKHKTKKR